LTWHDTSDGYAVFFNRDERSARKPGVAPARRRRGVTRFLSPLDGDRGGTWIAVNEYGLTVCLLNGFPAQSQDLDAAGEFKTRGSIPLTAIECASSAEVARRLRACSLECFRPFVLVTFEPGGAGLTARWSGAMLEIDDGRPPRRPLVSSSFFTEEVRSSRVAVFESLRREQPGQAPTDLHLAFHRSHRPERGPHSPCMHRADASTVSFSHIEVSATEVQFHYTGNSPCRGLPQVPAGVLTRSAAEPSQARSPGHGQ
jgi:hypothetical protein